MYSFNLNAILLLFLFHVYGHLMSFENQKWSENAPEVISEGLKFKIFLEGGGGGGGGGHAPRPPYRVHCRVQSSCPPKFYLCIILPPLVHFSK